MIVMQHIGMKSVVVGVATIVGIVLDEKTGVPMFVAVAVASAWGSGLWWLGRKLQSLEDGLKIALEDRARAREVMADLVKRVNALPCTTCEPAPKGKSHEDAK